MAKRPFWTYTFEIRYRCGTRHMRRLCSASDKTATRHIVQRHVERDKDLMSILLIDKWPKAKKDRQAYLEAKRAAKADKLRAEQEAYASYTDEDI